MAGTTPTYSWPYPESSDFVADGATAIENLADAADTTVAGLGSWSTYSATLTAANPMTVTTTYARYCEVNGLVVVAAYFDITNNGGNTGTCDMTLPVPVAGHYVSGALIGSGRENKLNGHSVLVHVSGSAGRLRYYQNGVTANNNYAYGVFLTYEAA